MNYRSSSIDPTIRIQHSDSEIKSVDTLENLCLKSLEPYRTQIPLHQLSSEVQTLIIRKLCSDEKNLEALEQFNVDYMKQLYGDDISEEMFDWAQATENVWRSICSRMNSSPMDFQRAQRTDPYRPYRRLYLILKAKEDELKEAVDNKLMETKQLEEKSKNRTMLLTKNIQKPKGDHAFIGNKNLSLLGKRKRSPPKKIEQPLLKKALKTAHSLMIQNNGYNPLTATSEIKSKPKVIRRLIPTDSLHPNVQISLTEESKMIKPKINESKHSLSNNNNNSNNVKKSMTNISNNIQQNQFNKKINKNIDPFTPPPPVTGLRHKKINLLERPPSQSLTTQNNQTNSVSSINSLFSKFDKNNPANKIKQDIKRTIKSRQYNEETKNSLKSLGKIPKK